MKALLLKTTGGDDVIINEEQVCYVRKSTNCVVLVMSSGDVLEIHSPTWDEWENDYHRRNQ